MARFRVYRLRSADQLAIDLQSDFLQDLPSRVMAPLQPVEEVSWVITRLTPRFDIDGRTYVMATQRLSALPASAIGPEIADLGEHADIITAATDFLFQGF
ncbi:CcdB family protein [Rhizobium halophytocola]|uniref:Toxin CcdB n=1 Tax=Rhizobium halophytocola TaxID=735519 RepID=A0ABS4E1G2_9HYPH|nr:CcdB family protein [Rhizobium halophytocola]MBP1851782.1 toxin CcdB [Rhizobium halophytocola]